MRDTAPRQDIPQTAILSRGAQAAGDGVDGLQEVDECRFGGLGAAVGHLLAPVFQKRDLAAVQYIQGAGTAVGAAGEAWTAFVWRATCCILSKGRSSTSRL